MQSPLQPARLGASICAESPELKAALSAWDGRQELAIAFDRRRTISGLNHAFARKFGRAAEKLIGAQIADLIHPDDREDWKSGTTALETNWKPVSREHRWNTAQGWRWLSWEESYLFDEDGLPSVVIAIGRDVTRRRLAEEHFSKLARAVEQSPVSILMTALDGTVQYVNSTYTEASGYTLEDIFDREIRVLREGHPNEESFRECEEILARGRSWTGELSTRRKNGDLVWERVQISPIHGATGEKTHLLCMREDITLQKNLEFQLRQAQKMDSLGTLASGIAHDFNNILAIIRGFSELLQLREPLSESGRGKVRKILDATNRACELIRRILTFSRQGEISFRPVRVNAQIEEFARLLNETFPRNIAIELDLDERLPQIPADVAQLQQVIMNLCVNARDAMPGGGRLELKTSRVKGAARPHLDLDHDLNYVSIEISDTGKGMSPAVVSRIFEPFYTTKNSSGGTGLGLSVVYGIVSSHFGTIDVESAIESGSTFSVYLPIKEVDEAEGVEEAENAFPPGVERIAIVDDEPGICDLLAVAFQSHGYLTHTFADGQAVRDAVAGGAFEFDAVIMDLDMPHVNGAQLLRELQQSFSNLPIIVMTGHLQSTFRAELEAMESICYLHKPFHLSQVGLQTRRMLDGSKR